MMFIRLNVVVLIAFAALPLLAQETATKNSQPRVKDPEAAESLDAVEKLKTLNDHFPFVVPDTVSQWNSRRDALRNRVLVAAGLLPMPARPEIEPKIYGKVQREGFTVEKVSFESLPGHFVSGLLFRPDGNAVNRGDAVNPDGKHPGVLSPHGHGGRTMRLDDKELAKQIKMGGEIYPESGRYPKLARCAHLARMGCVCFIFDMLGYADSQQIAFETAHRHKSPRPEDSGSSLPVFFSIRAELNQQSIMGLQTFNAIRALDFLADLPDVDADRLGVTGGSGGGTQTILLGAIDPRVKASFPNGMVSTSMQGGCYCENCSYLRIGTGNVELAALFAPRPQGMTAAEDWTRDMMTDGFPELKKLYAMLGEPDNVLCRPLLQFPHNYNYVTRSTMYPWMARHLGIPDAASLVEKDFKPLSESEMQVYDDEHPAPAETGIPHERKVLAWWKQQSDTAIEKANKQDRRDLMEIAWRDVIFDREMPAISDLEIKRSGTFHPTESGQRFHVSHKTWGVETVANLFESAKAEDDNQVFLFAVPDHEEIGSLESAREWITKNVSHANELDLAGSGIVLIQVRHQQPVQAMIDDDRDYAGFTFTYNRPLAVKQCQEVLCGIAAFAANFPDRKMTLVASGDTLVATSAAGVVAGPSVDRLVVESGGFRFANLKTYRDPQFLPGASKYGGLAGLLSLRVPYKLNVYDDGQDGFVDRIGDRYEAWEVTSEFNH